MTKTIPVGDHYVHIIEAQSGFTVAIGTSVQATEGIEVSREQRKILAGIAVQTVVNTLTAVANLRRQGKDLRPSDRMFMDSDLVRA